jgi:hypothetical protein
MNRTGSTIPPISNPEAGGLEPLRRALTRYEVQHQGNDRKYQ